MPPQNGQSTGLREDLRAVFDRAKLPTNPAIAAEVLNLVNDPNSSADQFARVIETDPALAARLMKVCNSAYFAQRTPVTTIQRAVTVLGLRRIRVAAVSFQLVSHLNRLGKVSFDLSRYWQQSVLRACLAREIARRVVPQLTEEAFLVGLLQDCGILLLVQMLGEDYGELYSQENLTPTAFYTSERKHFKYNHVEVISAMAQEWKLPETIAAPLGRHHRRERLGKKSKELERLCAVSYFVGSVRFRSDQRGAESEPHLQEYARDELKLNEETVQNCFVAAGEAYQSTSELFEDVLPDDIDVTDLLDEANRKLSRAANETERQAHEAMEQRDQYREERATLQNAVAQYRERAARDPLTGIFNRGALVESTLSCLRQSRESDKEITLFFLDIDNFKKLNDEHGHGMGDQVLCFIAEILQESVGDAGFAGRYGGEEFVVVMAGLNRDEAESHAHRLVASIHDAEYAQLGLESPVTCSLGAIWGSADHSPEQLFELADGLMYEAKRSGKDKAVFRKLQDMECIMESESLAVSNKADGKPDSELKPQDMMEKLKSLATELNNKVPTDGDTSRNQSGKNVLSPGEMSYFAGPSLKIISEKAFVRNISVDGIGLLCSMQMLPGDLIEVSIPRKDGTFYAAGLVESCRQVTEGVFEIGIQVVNHGRVPIFSHNPREAIAALSWLEEAIREKFGGVNDARRSA